jgi:hypothetical protein
MNKYSKNIILNLKDYNFNVDTNIDNKYDSFILKLKDTFVKIEDYVIENDSLHVTKHNDLYIKHNNTIELPYVYKLLKKLYSNNINPLQLNDDQINNFITFLNKYRIFHTKLNLEFILNNNSTFIEYNYDFIKKEVDFIKKHNKLYYNTFVSIDIQNHIETENFILKTIKNENITINLYYIKNYSTPDFNLLLKIIKFIKIIANKEILPVDLTIYYGKQKKMFTIENILSPENINSGSTYPEREITIWRAEELYKVLIHEMIHYVYFDYNSNDNIFNVINNILYNNINIDKTIMSSRNNLDANNESYTETLAIFLLCIINSVLLNMSFYDLIKIELNFSLFQISKIINFFGGNKFENIFKQNSKKSITIKQTTSVCSYFIIKTFNLIFFNDFLEYIFNNGFCIKKNKETIDNYIDYYNNIIEKSKSLNYKYSSVINELLDKLNNKNITQTFMLKTLRMSCVEI